MEPGHETKQWVNVLPVISPLVKMFVEDLPDEVGVEEASLSDSCGRTEILDCLSHVPAQPHRDRHHESCLAPTNDLIWQEAPDRSLQNILGRPFAFCMRGLDASRALGL